MAGDGSNEFARKVASNARQRCVGGVMTYAEKNIYPKMTAAERTAFRDKVLQSVGAYHDTLLDLLTASVDDGTLKVNEHALAAIDRMNRLAATIEGQIGA
jgi:hypothetical protein